jgi:hypothetical protein
VIYFHNFSDPLRFAFDFQCFASKPNKRKNVFFRFGAKIFLFYFRIVPLEPKRTAHPSSDEEKQSKKKKRKAA